MQLEALRSGLNKDLPKMVDSITRLDEIDLSDKGYTYFETITIRVEDKDAMLALVKPSIAKGLCKDAKVLNLLKDGIIYRYVYTGKNGQSLGDIIITKTDCQI